MRRFVLTVSLSSIGLFGQEATAPPPALKAYQSLALQHLWKQHDAKTFDPKSAPMEKILTAAVMVERGCSIPLLQGEADWTVDSRIRKMSPPVTDKITRLRQFPTCPRRD